MLDLQHVSKHFSGIPAVDDVSFCANPGEVTGYLGPNGSGKSTTMKMITGLIEMTFGRILFEGKPIQDDLMAYKRRMGYVPRSRTSTRIFQGPNTSPWFRSSAICRSESPQNKSTAFCDCFLFMTTGARPSPAIRRVCARRF